MSSIIGVGAAYTKRNGVDDPALEVPVKGVTNGKICKYRIKIKQKFKERG